MLEYMWMCDVVTRFCKHEATRVTRKRCINEHLSASRWLARMLLGTFSLFFLFLKLFLFYFMFMDTLCTCMSVHHVHTWCHRQPEESVGYTATEITDGCEPL